VTPSVEPPQDPNPLTFKPIPGQMSALVVCFQGAGVREGQMCRTQVSGYEIAAGCFRAHPRRTSTRCILPSDRRGSKTSPDVGRICASRSHAICQSGKSSQGSFTSYDLNRTDLNKLSPQGRRDDMPPPRRWQFDSWRIYVRPRTGPQSARLWWPASCRQPASR